ncbi:tRNA specific adenosine A34 deaminase [Petrocella atlantisensis]|uniref:tRNA-specific adenosine deaminase n=1 Tax=Petrocella atlantisensis TaxID=2173034 RepID=A0A3P7P2E1_9FIRM|nr:tRNA adenosine(34) deaminase TadA [Petrocella atlantisensis]PKM54807.1 MAG: tRNA-specific adenosine deaminase [Firmicutes bacterium HGW-Firmicutes-5]VDN47660.1 tRNA specific adenosine A34 deaminase [Petrocella atlantisensis]
MEKWMEEAIKEGKKAAKIMEVPIGAIIVHEGQIIGRGYNQRNSKKSTLAHAELIAIEEASKVIGDWRLEGCTMYVTVEPCPMCAGAIVQARLDKVVIGTMNLKAGCAGSIYNLLDDSRFNHQVSVVTGVCQEACATMMSEFFKTLREVKKTDKIDGRFIEEL